MELRSFGLGPHFKDRFQELRKHIRDTRLSLLRDRGIAEAQAGILAVAIGGGGGLWMLRQALLGFLTLGDLALAYQAFQQGQAMARTLLGKLGQLYTNMLYLGSLFEFLQLEPRIVDRPGKTHAPEHLQEGIRFEGVSFRYPRSDRDALRDLDLFIPAGRITAIVGANGSGKSTLIKLMCRFYDPNDGQISIDGVDFKNVSVEDLRQRISAAFQQPVRFSASAAENVSYGDLPRAGDEQSVRIAVTAAGADEIVGRLPRGYETPLGNWFKGGRELSVGEWQRIALARALFRKAPILLLDEPTSAMDTWAEAEWLSRFRALVADRTTLLVTHRFAAAMRADLIHVMADGRVVESGTHHELISRGGLYARSWASQTSAA
jgi:ATP-binding cassette subfamily B protein